MSNATEQKAALRAQVSAELRKMTPEERTAASRLLCARLEEQTLWREAKSVLFYAPLREEPDVWPLVTDAIAGGKMALLPRFDAEQKHYVVCQINDAVRDVWKGQFGVREPMESCAKISLNRLDLILVPGIAFDLDGRRLGRGMGFYDRLLAVLHGPTCGVAFDQQIVRQIPVEPHDMRLSCILTPTRWHCQTGPRAVLK